MGALYGLAYLTNKMDDKKDEAITKLYQDLKREFFNGASYENMFPSSPVDAPIKDEKQGEQKPVECIKFDNEFENQISHLIASVLNGEHEYNEGFVKYASQSLLGFAKKEQKPIEQDTEIRDLWVYIREWNEKFGRLPKDEDELAALIDYVTKRQKSAVIIPKFRVGDKIRRKTLRPYDKDMQVASIEGDYYICNHLGKFSSETISFSEESNYELVEQKSAWSEEDERIRKELIAYLDVQEVLSGYKDKDFKNWIAWPEKQGEQKLYMIQWKGNNLKEIVEFTGKSPKFNDWFKTWEEYENYVHTHNNIFKMFNEDGSHVEVPVGAWIIKTPDGYNVASRYVFKQKSADKVEPKFKIGDWITNGEYIWNITDIKPLDYILQSPNGNTVDDTISHVNEYFHLWTIQDAKPGDVLSVTFDEWCKIVIFLSLNDENVEGYGITLKNGELWFTDCDISYYSKTWTSCLEPATKEQRDTLFSKIKEAGYEWNAEKKELNKIEKQGEQKSSWSKDDEKMWVQVINEIEAIKSNSSTIFEKNIAQDKIDWLKSIKPNHWKPSKEQIGALNYAYCELFKRGENGEGSNCVHPLMTLIDDLKKL